MGFGERIWGFGWVGEGDGRGKTRAEKGWLFRAVQGRLYAWGVDVLHRLVGLTSLSRGLGPTQKDTCATVHDGRMRLAEAPENTEKVTGRHTASKSVQGWIPMVRFFMDMSTEHSVF